MGTTRIGGKTHEQHGRKDHLNARTGFSATENGEQAGNPRLYLPQASLVGARQFLGYRGQTSGKPQGLLEEKRVRDVVDKERRRNVQNPQRPVDTTPESEESNASKDAKQQTRFLFHVLDENGYFEGAD